MGKDSKYREVISFLSPKINILDWYILKKYLVTFFAMLLMFIPIGILVDFAEKLDKIMERKPPIDETVMYYLNFVVYFANILFPIFLFLSVIFFTSIMANRTEIVAMLSSGISYNRFLKPYFYGATILAVFSFGMSMFLVPYSSGVYQTYYSKYLMSSENGNSKVANYYNQIKDDEIIYVGEYDDVKKEGDYFCLEKFEGLKLVRRITADRIQWIDSLKRFRMYNYKNRKITGSDEDMMESKIEKDTVFGFKAEDLIPIDYAAETKNLFELDKFIEQERRKGSPNIRTYEMVYYKRWGFIFTSYILTFIGVAVSSVKKRGGMGANLAFGIIVGLSYVFLDRLFGTMTEKSGLSPFLAVAIPNVIFLVLAIILIRRSRR